jgi:hypothetical protein
MSDRFDYSVIPAHTLEALERFRSNKLPPGGFLSAVINGDLYKAVSHADDSNAACIVQLANYIYNHGRIPCGYPEAVNDYLSS